MSIDSTPLTTPPVRLQNPAATIKMAGRRTGGGILSALVIDTIAVVNPPTTNHGPFRSLGSAAKIVLYIVVIGFTGIRGVVSLAVALALPLTLPNGQDFPHRDLILLITFGVIAFTLVGIGLTLPMLVKALGLSEHGQLEAIREREAEIAARREILESARGSLDRIIKHLLPFVGVILVCLMIITYVPSISLALRDLVYAK